MQQDVYYRYDGHFDETGFTGVWLSEYRIVKKTPCGVWINDHSKKGRFILHGARKRWAYPTKELALTSLARRTAFRVSYCRAALDRAETLDSFLASHTMEEIIEAGDHVSPEIFLKEPGE